VVEKLETLEQVYALCQDDPVRPHISADQRLQNGKDVLIIRDDKENITAVICIAYTNEVPTNEKELEYYAQAACQDGQHGSIAVAYTVWSYSKGAGREIVLQARNFIKQHRPVTRLITLSPLTEMAERFHIRNGATLLAVHPYAQNFEYKI
jgi:uncharacterized protein YabE (DUF348 family)|tara:strand:+ start:456 stop:908 length:453 start_codon:yes stop_codon:yes gene_type:complete